MHFVPFGDSHSIFWGQQQSFDTPISNVTDTPHLHWIGPAKIYGLENPTNNNTQEKFLFFKDSMLGNPDSIPIACFGEIDIRVNIAKIVLEDRSFSCISKLADIYLRNLNELPNQRIVVWGPPPAPFESGGILSQDYPVYGSGITRNSIVHLFNLALLRRINEYPRIRFITLFYDLVDVHLATHPAALHDVNHLSINHFPQARELLSAVLSDGNKAALNVPKMQSIADVNFSVQSIQREELSYATNMQFSGPFQFQYFSNLRFSNENYSQSELVLQPGGTGVDILAPAQIGNFAFLELFFQGRSEYEFVDFARFCATFNSTNIDIFDAKDIWSTAFQSNLKKHEKVMRRRYALTHGDEASSRIKQVNFPK